MQIFQLFFSLLWRTSVVNIALLIALGIAVDNARPILPDFITNHGHASFIYLKPTLIYVTIATLLLASEFLLSLNPFRMTWGSRLNLSDAQWRSYLVSIAVLLLSLAALNTLVAYTGTVSTWVNYKLFGASALFLLGTFGITMRLRSGHI